LRRPPGPPPFPYTTLFRSLGSLGVAVVGLLALAVGRVLRWPALVAGLGSLGLGTLGSRALSELVTRANEGNTISEGRRLAMLTTDRKSTRLNSSHVKISYA